MKYVIRLICCLVVCLGLGAISWASSGDGYVLDWFAITNGGGQSKGGGFTLISSIGQRNVGTMNGDGYVLTSGFLTGVETDTTDTIQVYLPLLQR